MNVVTHNDPIYEVHTCRADSGESPEGLSEKLREHVWTWKFIGEFCKSLCKAQWHRTMIHPINLQVNRIVRAQSLAEKDREPPSSGEGIFPVRMALRSYVRACRSTGISIPSARYCRLAF